MSTVAPLKLVEFYSDHKRNMATTIDPLKTTNPEVQCWYENFNLIYFLFLRYNIYGATESGIYVLVFFSDTFIQNKVDIYNFKWRLKDTMLKELDLSFQLLKCFYNDSHSVLKERKKISQYYLR